MNLNHVRICLLLGQLGWIFFPGASFSQALPVGGVRTQASVRDGQHDFDFSIGTWKTHIRRLQHPLTGSMTWVEYDGISAVRPVWNGRGSLGETEADGPAGHLEALSLRLYNPRAHQWNLTYASGQSGVLSVPTIGEFNSDGRGEFYDTEMYNGRSILVRNVWADITPTSCHFEQAFSEDGGKTWEVNWSAIDTRLSEADAQKSLPPALSDAKDGQHDFDFQIGTWKPQIARLQHPLTGSTAWLEYAGNTRVRKVWNGKANLVELGADGPAGHLEILCLRLFNPQTRQWSLNYANSNDGIVSPPVTGDFADGRGHFYGQDQVNGKPVFVRNMISDITPDSCRFEQAFSDDGGKTWETNFKETLTRVKEGS
jgi:hypothetical protein